MTFAMFRRRHLFFVEMGIYAVQSTKISLTPATITTRASSVEGMDYSGVSFLVCRRKLRYLHHSFLRNTDAFGFVFYTELLVFTNQMLLPFPVSDEIYRVAFAI